MASFVYASDHFSGRTSAAVTTAVRAVSRTTPALRGPWTPVRGVVPYRRHAGVADRRQQPDGTAGAAAVDVRLLRGGGRGPAVRRGSRRRRSDPGPRTRRRVPLLVDVGRRRRAQDADDVERIRRRDAATSAAATAVTGRRHNGHVTAAGWCRDSLRVHRTAEKLR